MAQNDPSRGLAREAIGLREVLFQSITHMAPAAAVAFSIIVRANFAGGALPLSVVPTRPATRGAPSGWPSSTPASASACSTC